MKTILALVGGGERDQVICQTAIAAALPLSAHIEFLHMNVRSAEAARYNRVQFVRGDALRDTLEDLEKDARSFSELAAEHVREHCAAANIEICDTPEVGRGVTACFREEKESALERLIFHARHSDLVVMGRAKQTQGLAPDILERLVLSCGRPMLVAASAAPQPLTGTIMVCWNESGNSARAVSAATPLLERAKRVIFTSIVERDQGAAEAVDDIARRFAWNGVASEARVIQANGRKIPGLLAAAAEDCGADLVVMGAYGQSRARELVFGSCTEAFLQHADKPILLLH